jgi:hypothetical protein
MKGLIAGTCVFFLTFAAARALYVPLTYDEAAAYIRYIDTTFPSVFDTGSLSLFNFEVATNHFLNTVLTRLSYLAAGGSELSLRIPNLLGYAMYLAFSLLILHRFARDRRVAFGGFLLLNLNPYVLDFFTLSRGYGLSVGFLMGALFFLFRCLESLREGHAPARDLSRTLVFAGGAVLANFALLNVYLAIFVVLLVALFVFNRVAVRERQSVIVQHEPGGWQSRSVVWLPLTATVFTALVFSQDSGLSNALYEPVSVRAVGLEPADLDHVRVSRIDIRGRETRLRHDADATTWRFDQRAPVRGLKVELPASDAERLRRIEVVVGVHPFSTDPHRRDEWTTRDAGGSRVFESAPSLSMRRSRVGAFRSLMNWTGDRIYFRKLAARTAYALAILAGLAIILWAAGTLAVGARLLTRDQRSRLACGVLWLAAFAGPPLYLLRRDAQLYYGGVQGLVADTFFSVIDNSFYGWSYHTNQNQIAFAVVMVTIAVFPVVLYAGYRRRSAADMLPLTCTLAIILLASLAVAVQRLLFHTVYLLGRTALFYIPLYLLFFALLCDAAALCGRAGRLVAAVTLAIAVSVSTYHFARTANVTQAWDWLPDASTKTMMADLAQVVSAERGPAAHAVLAVDWIFTPVAAYYAHRTGTASIEVVGLPALFGADFLYLEEKNARPDMHVVRSYSLAKSLLVRVGGTP